MKIVLNNVGILVNTSVDINGLTVITGNNNSGKSTIGKVAFALINAVKNYSIRASVDRFYYAIEQLSDISKIFPISFVRSFLKNNEQSSALSNLFLDVDKLQKMELGEIDTFLLKVESELENLSYISSVESKKDGAYAKEKRVSWDFFDLNFPVYSEKRFLHDKEKAVSLVRNIIANINSDPDYRKYIQQSIMTQLNVEFSSQLAPARNPSCEVAIDVYDDEHSCFSLRIENWELKNENRSIFENSPYNNVVFVDDPYVIEDDQSWRSFKQPVKGNSYLDPGAVWNHRDTLRWDIKQIYPNNMWEQVVLSENYNKIKQKIDEILPGSFVKEGNEAYYTNGNEIKLKLSNLATGSKMFSIIKILLERGKLDSSTLLILDEPECHLHPEWQNLFAEIVVMLVKEVGCHVLLTTHSQNFLLALDAYTRKYAIENRSNFYQAKKDGSTISFKNVNSNMNLIYADFLRAFSRMKSIYDEIVYEKSTNEDVSF